MPSPQKPIALPRSCGGNASSRTACDSGCSAPPVAPCRIRKTISVHRFGARPQRNDAVVKPITDIISRFLRPNNPASQPVIGRMIALATRYDVSTQVASSIDTDRLPAMCGSDTFTTVVSSTSMKVANITEMAMIHGLIGFCSVMEARNSPWLLFRVHGRDDRHPGPQQSFGILRGVEHDLHGDALDDFDEVAGGILRRQQAEARAGRAGDAVHFALELASAERVDFDFGALAWTHVPQLRLFEVRGHPHVIDLHEREERLARLDDLSRIDAFLRDDAGG